MAVLKLLSAVGAAAVWLTAWSKLQDALLMRTGGADESVNLITVPCLILHRPSYTVSERQINDRILVATTVRH